MRWTPSAAQLGPNHSPVITLEVWGVPGRRHVSSQCKKSDLNNGALGKKDVEEASADVRAGLAFPAHQRHVATLSTSMLSVT